MHSITIACLVRFARRARDSIDKKGACIDRSHNDTTRLDTTRLDSTRLDSTRLDSLIKTDFRRRVACHGAAKIRPAGSLEPVNSGVKNRYLTEGDRVICIFIGARGVVHGSLDRHRAPPAISTTRHHTFHASYSSR